MVISRVTVTIAHIRELSTPLMTTQEPSSRPLPKNLQVGFRLSGFRLDGLGFGAS